MLQPAWVHEIYALRGAAAAERAHRVDHTARRRERLFGRERPKGVRPCTTAMDRARPASCEGLAQRAGPDGVVPAPLLGGSERLSIAAAPEAALDALRPHKPDVLINLGSQSLAPPWTCRASARGLSASAVRPAQRRRDGAWEVLRGEGLTYSELVRIHSDGREEVLVHSAAATDRSSIVRNRSNCCRKTAQFVPSNWSNCCVRTAVQTRRKC